MIKTLSSLTPKESWTTLDLNGMEPPAIDSEFKPKAVTDVFSGVGLPHGRCFGSKSGYRYLHRRHYFVPNANVFCRQHGKVWWGDLDLWRDFRMLEQAANRLRCRLYVLWENDGRFKNSELPFPEVQRRAIWHTGGSVRPDQKLIKRSGLSVDQLALLIRIPVCRLSRRQIPFFTLQINRRLSGLETVFQPFADHHGYKKWGDWLVGPHQVLQGKSPFETLQNGGKINLSELEPEVTDVIAVLDLLSLYFTEIELKWPRVERRL